MDTITAVKNRIFKLCYDRNISINRLATICALPPSSVKNILYGKSQNPKLLTIKMICDGLDMTLAEFFDTDEFNNLEQGIIDNENVNIIGSQIKAAREKLGMTQKQLSEKLELEAVYTCRGSISRIENGKRAVTDIEIDAISRILNVSLDFLFGRE